MKSGFAKKNIFLGSEKLCFVFFTHACTASSPLKINIWKPETLLYSNNMMKLNLFVTVLNLRKPHLDVDLAKSANSTSKNLF